MAMNGDVMGLAIANAVLDPSASAEAKAQVIAMWQKIATQIVTHIQTNASVLPGIAVTTSGSPAAHTGATTSPGQIQ